MPGVDMSTRKQVMPSCLGAAGLVRARQMPQSASLAMVVHTFWPVSDQPPSTRSARVASDARSEPAPGSENSWHHVSSWRSDGAMNCSCWARGAVGDERGQHPPRHLQVRAADAGGPELLVDHQLLERAGRPGPTARGQWGQIQPGSARRVFQLDRSSRRDGGHRGPHRGPVAPRPLRGRSSCSVRRVPATAASSDLGAPPAGSPSRE